MEGFSLQLGLLGLIAEAGGFDESRAPPLASNMEPGARQERLGYVTTPLGGPQQIGAEDFLDRARRAFTAAAAKWLTGSEPFTAKVKPEYSFPNTTS